MRCLGIDLGATFIKAAVLDTEEGAVGHSIRVPFPPFLPPSFEGQREVSVAAIVENCREVLQRVAAVAGDFSAVFVSGQMGGLVLLDGEARALTNHISWQDMRWSGSEKVAGSAASLRQRLAAGDIEETGNDFRASAPLKVLHWMAIRDRLPDGAIPVSLAGLLISQLTGSIPAIHISDAAAYGCMDLARRAWHADMIATARLDHLSWPPIVAEPVPVAAITLGKQRVPIYCGFGDQQASLAGADLEPKELSLNIATGSQISCLSANIQHGDFQVRPYFDGQYLCTISHLPAGRAINALLRFMHLDESVWSEVEACIKQTADTDLKVDLSFFPGPAGSSGSITGMREGNMTLGHLFRAIFENMASNYSRCALQLPLAEPSGMVFSGGLAIGYPSLRNEVLRRLEMPHRVASEKEDALRGLLLVATGIAQKQSVQTAKRQEKE